MLKDFPISIVSSRVDPTGVYHIYAFGGWDENNSKMNTFANLTFTQKPSLKQRENQT